MHRHEAASGATGAAKAGTASVLTALKVSSLIVAIPLMVCIVIAVWSFLRWIKEDQAHLDKERAPRNHD